MTRATGEDGTAGLGQTLRTGRSLVGGVFLPWRLWSVHESTVGIRCCQEGLQVRRRPMQAWSLGLGARQMSVIHTLSVAISVVSSVPRP